MTLSLRKFMAIETTDFTGPPSHGVAHEAAQMLEGCVLGSDIDTPYWPCIIRGLTDDPWRALGIPRDERVKLSGFESPRLELRDVPAVLALRNLSDDDLEDIGDYVEPDEQELLERVGTLLEKTGPRINLVLAFPEESCKLVLVLAKTGNEHVGVASTGVYT